MTTESGHIERPDLLLRSIDAMAFDVEDQAHLRSCIVCRRELESAQAARGERERATTLVVSARSDAKWDRKRREILAFIQEDGAKRARLHWTQPAVAASLLAAFLIPVVVEMAREPRMVLSPIDQQPDAIVTTTTEIRSADADEWLRELTRLSAGTEDEGSWTALAPLPPQEGDER